MLQRTLVLSAVLATCSCSMQTSISPESGNSAQEIVGGSSTTDYPAVAHISVRTAAGSFACSSTLISPKVLLTAAHCLDDLDGGAATGLTAYFGSTVVSDDPVFVEEVEASDPSTWLIHPNWFIGANDIALVLLDHDSRVEPMNINTQTPFANQNLHIVGWGNSDFNIGGGFKRHVNVNLDGVNSANIEHGTSTRNTCQGDSGGPNFIQVGGQERVAGITSFGEAGCRGPSESTRVDVHAAMINNYVATRDIAQPPELEIIRPVDGSEVGGGFPIEIEASDDTRIERFEIYVNGTLAIEPNINQPPYIYNAPDIPDGPVELEVRVYDNRGDSNIKSVKVTMDNTCDGPDDCPKFFECTAEKVCKRQSLGLGEICEGGPACESGSCAKVGDESRCTMDCDPAAADSCESGFECLAAGEAGLCWPEESSGGCSTSGGRVPSWSWIFLLGLLWYRRPRR